MEGAICADRYIKGWGRERGRNWKGEEGKGMLHHSIEHIQFPVWDFGVTYSVHLWLVGKRVVNFLLALIELLPALTVEAP